MFIDESGDSEHCLSLSALSFQSGVDVDAEAATEGLIEELAAVIPGLDVADELHANKLARKTRRKELMKRGGEALLRTHERDFIYQQSLHHLGDLPTVAVFTVMWRWSGAGRKRDQRGGERCRALTLRLLEWIGEGEEYIDRAVIDASGQHDHYRRGFADFAATSVLLLREPEAMASEDSRLLQLADLTAYAAFQQCNPGRNSDLDRMAGWHRDALQDIWAPGGDGHGCRHFKGDGAEPA